MLLSHPHVSPRLWRNALFVVFALTGAGQAAWITRTPSIRAALDLTVGEMGWIIFGISVGSVAGLLVASRVVARWGGRTGMLAGAICIGAGLIAAGAGTELALGWLAFIGLSITGAGFGLLEVALNVEGAALERHVGRTCLPAIHAAFSIGTLVGSGLGAGAVFAGTPVLLHLGMTGALVIAGTAAAVRLVAAGTGVEPRSPKATGSASGRVKVWREPRTMILGVVVMGMAFAEGAGNDWIPLALVDGYGISEFHASLGFAVYAGLMTLVRMLGARLVARFGRRQTLQGLGLFAAAGLLLVIFGSTPALAMVGVGLWGAGVALGFPLGLSAAGDDPNGTAARVSAVATAGYIAFLVGPPVLGLLGDHNGIRSALLIVLAGVAVAIGFSQSTRPISSAPAPAGPNQDTLTPERTALRQGDNAND
ncbi:MFS transporter [Pseudarthrobacter raffinosi]|uniref:MFS transporter n=1 Tax=Pseudarthrobacter raffinosi TaxID=2953651 RepID=UPI00208FDB3E|nr:MFS transporter [Pseudarthrobacter sp. MDT3-9]MCO4253248.1 MFS transporter [Pseudarthrobacter sp. MDT3-9]